MKPSVSLVTRHFLSLLFSAVFLVACSSSSTTPSNTNDGTPSDGANNPGNDPTNAPMSLITTRANVDIQVPPYQSNELRVRLTAGEKVADAKWVGDEFWSASIDLPASSDVALVVTFSDRNGDITLGSVQQMFNSGDNAFLDLKITADQFDTNSWDDDADGISNIDELVAGSNNPDAVRILLFSETRDFRHDSTETALAALAELSASANIQSDRANDSAGVFTDANLANYNAVVWVMTSGDVLNTNEQAAFERFIQAGGGYAGIHAASFTEYEWPWYGSLVGAYFDSHPAVQTATQNVEDVSHASTAHLDSTWTREDEWYDYRSNPRSQVNVLLSLDESSYIGGTMGIDHPSAWYHEYDGGRSWYTGGGHTEESYSEPDFRTHLLGGLRYVTGVN